jgi:hypothetical protein
VYCIIGLGARKNSPTGECSEDYPGSLGYRLAREAAIAEIQTATPKLRHQARERSERALQINRVYHAKL